MKGLRYGVATILGGLQMTTAAQTCYSGVYVIAARGTFELQGVSLQDIAVNAIVAKIPNSNASAVVYPASITDINDSIAAGVNNTQQQIYDYHAACPHNKLVLMGYSQGAQVIGNAIAGGGTITPDGTPSPPATPIAQSIGANVISVVLFGDPQQVRGQGVNNEVNPCPGNSSLARTGAEYEAMEFYADRLDEYCNDQDPVCCSTGDNTLAHLSYFNTTNANAIAEYVYEKYQSAQ